MYIIKKIAVDNSTYVSSSTVDLVATTISTAKKALENAAKNFVLEECGRQAFEHAKILDIYNSDQIHQPEIDCILLYRLSDDPDKIHVYQRKTELVKQSGWFGISEIPVPTFKRTHIFELEESQSIILDVKHKKEIEIEETDFVDLGKLRVPKKMTEIISQMKENPMFQERLRKITAAETEEKNTLENLFITGQECAISTEETKKEQDK